jgi:hypothetical protein
MMQLNIRNFLEKGQLFDFNEIGTEKLLVARLGEPDDVEDYGDKGKYLHYKNLRFLFLQDSLDGIAIFFMNHETAFEVNIDNEVFIVHSGMPLTSLLHMLNKINLKWTIPYEQSKLDYLLIEIKSGVKIYYYFENNLLERITKKFS